MYLRSEWRAPPRRGGRESAASRAAGKARCAWGTYRRMIRRYEPTAVSTGGKVRVINTARAPPAPPPAPSAHAATRPRAAPRRRRPPARPAGRAHARPTRGSRTRVGRRGSQRSRPAAASRRRSPLGSQVYF